MLFSPPHILIFVALLLVHYGVDGVQITGLSPRDHGPPNNGPPVPAPASTTSPINTSPSQSSLTSQTSGTRTSPSSGASLSSSASSLATSASNTEASLAESRKVGTIVGAVLVSVILSSLGLMAIAHFRRRARKARKLPRGSVYFEPETEMSQTQNGPPLTSSAPLIHRPEPLHFFNSPSSSTNNTTSLSPLLPAATFLDATLSSSHRPLSTREFDGNTDEQPSDPLPSPFDTHDLSLVTPLLKSAVSAGPASPSTSSQLSPLHRDMAGFQKTLEADLRRDISDQSQSSTISNPIGDPPPKYIG